MANEKMEKCIARDGGRESEDAEEFKGSFMELLIEEDDNGEVVSGKAEESGFVFFPPNRFLPVSSSSSTVRMLCFGGEEEVCDNGGVLSISPTPIDENCKPRNRRVCSSAASLQLKSLLIFVIVQEKKPMSAIEIGRGGGRCGRVGSAVSACSKRKKAESEASPVSRAVQMGREKLGSQVRALQQLVSPMGKSDTASVLQETFGYIRFLHDQVQLLSSAYMEAETDSAMEPDSRGGEGHLRKRGLCLVPVSITVTIAESNGADMWAPAISFNTAIAPPYLRRAPSPKLLTG
ncbi:transcription factor bHLH113 [Dendrobium catenatum]|uniref:transcription factor bHLH113 n=1 Tax=Dendrobium catenatum TaxID=906689 RepID=UPI0010A0B8B3|nr:transcription factor bHLH113 [Dendrobium catenatum]